MKGVMSTGRLTIGIISIVLFLFISFQSCAAGVYNTLDANSSRSGSDGLLAAIFMLIAGIIGICTRNSKSKIGPVFAFIFYLLSSFLCFGSDGTFEDLYIWGTISIVFGLIFLICAIKTKIE